MPHLFQLSLQRKSHSSSTYTYKSPKRKEEAKQKIKKKVLYGKLQQQLAMVSEERVHMG